MSATGNYSCRWTTMKLGEKCNEYNDKLVEHNNKYKAEGLENISEEQEPKRERVKSDITSNVERLNVSVRATSF